MKMTPEQELLQEELQQQAAAQAAVQTSAQSQQASNVDTASIADGALDILEIGLDLLTSAGSATVDGACAVASGVGDVVVGTCEVAGSVIGGIGELIGEILS